MAIPKKGTRLITVDGERYRWVVIRDDEFCLKAIVELADSPKQRIVTHISSGDIVTPAEIERIIRAAVCQGWSPCAPGKQLEFRIIGNLTEMFSRVQRI